MISIEEQKNQEKTVKTKAMVIQIVLGFYENELKNIALDLASEISYKKHKQELLNIYNTFNITEEIIKGDDSINPSEDCDIIIKELRKLLKNHQYL